MNRFFDAFANIFRISELRNRILFTLAILTVYRLGAFIPLRRESSDVLRQRHSSRTRDRFWESSTCSAAATSAS